MLHPEAADPKANQGILWLYPVVLSQWDWTQPAVLDFPLGLTLISMPGLPMLWGSSFFSFYPQTVKSPSFNEDSQPRMVSSSSRCVKFFSEMKDCVLPNKVQQCSCQSTQRSPLPTGGIQACAPDTIIMALSLSGSRWTTSHTSVMSLPLKILAGSAKEWFWIDFLFAPQSTPCWAETLNFSHFRA